MLLSFKVSDNKIESKIQGGVVVNNCYIILIAA